MNGKDADELLTPGEVARLFGVDPKTVTRWASAGKLSPLRTLGGHRRYRAGEVYTLLERSGRTVQTPSHRIGEVEQRQERYGSTG